MRAWAEAAKARGFEIPREALLKTRAVNTTIAKATFQEYCGKDFPYDLLRIERVSIAEQMIAEASVDTLLKPYVHQVLGWLQQSGITITAASSTNYKTTVDHLKHAGLYDYFSVIVGGDMVTKGKPEPDIFLLAADLAHSSACECVVVGDSPADVFAASAAQMTVYLIPDQVPANPQTTALANQVLCTLNQLPEHIHN